MAHRDMAWVVKGKLAQLLGNAGLSRVVRFRSLIRDRMRPPRHAELVPHLVARPCTRFKQAFWSQKESSRTRKERHPQDTV